MRRPASLLALLLQLLALASAQQVQIGPPAASFVPLFVPDVPGTIAASLPPLVASHGGADVQHVLMEFYAPWCPHCQHFAPELERIGEAFNGGPPSSGVLVCRVNCVADHDICVAMGITGFPTMYWGTTAQFLDAERTQNFQSSGLASVNANPRDADGVTLWINQRVLYDGGHASVLSDAAIFDASLAAQMQSVFSAQALAQQQAGGGGAAQPAAASAALNLWDVELAMVMSVQIMLAQPLAAAQIPAMTAFVELLGRNSGPLAQCQGNMPQLARFVATVTPGSAPLAGLMRSWSSPCGRPIAYYGSADSDWAMCKGSYPTTRGYTCGLWQLFHLLIAQSTDATAAGDLATVRGWIDGFFGCADCRTNFMAMSVDLASNVRTRDDAVLWLWQAHNSVNLRLAQEQFGQTNLFKYDPAAPKVAWPSASDCPDCHRMCPAGMMSSMVVANRDALVWQPTPMDWDVTAVVTWLNTFYQTPGLAQPTACSPGPPPTTVACPPGAELCGDVCSWTACSPGPPPATMVPPPPPPPPPPRACEGPRLDAELTEINSACCPSSGTCASIPEGCPPACGAIFAPWWASCVSQPGVLSQASNDLVAFSQTCTAPAGSIGLDIPVGLYSADPEYIGADLWDAVLSACIRSKSRVNGQAITAVDYSLLLPNDAAAPCTYAAHPPLATATARCAFEAYIDFLAGPQIGLIPSRSPRSRKALLINAYNALAVKTVVERFAFGSMSSIRDVGDIFSPVWTSVAGTLNGSPVSLDTVEKGTGADGGLTGLLPWYQDPRIHSSVICASVSCPDLSPRAFTGQSVDTLLDARVQAWLSHTTKGLSVDRGSGVITASKIFDWYRGDFDGWPGGFRGFLQQFAPPDVVAVLRALPAAAFAQTAVVYFDYDWNLNAPSAGAPAGGGH